MAQPPTPEEPRARGARPGARSRSRGLTVRQRTILEAIQRSIAALESFRIEGIKTNIPLHLRILRDPAFQAGQLDTRFLEHHAKP